MNKVVSENQYFSVVELAKGVYAALENAAGDAGSNAGFIDMGSFSLVFDTFLNLDAAQCLKEACLTFTGKTPQYVINSHYHADHVMGNMLFGDSIVVSSAAAANMMRMETETAVKHAQGLGDAYFDDIRAKLATCSDRDERLNLANELKFMGCMARSGLKLSFPSLTITGQAELHGEGRVVELRTFDTAHSPGDLTLHLPQEKICFAGDLLFTDYHPWLGAGDPEAFCEVLNTLSSLELNVVVPGHGRLGTIADLSNEAKYIKELLHLVGGRLEAGKQDTITLEDLSPQYREWQGATFRWNVEFLIEKLMQEGS